MNKLKLFLFVGSVILLIILISIQIELHVNWSQMQKEYASEVPFLESQQSREIENRIFRLDMGISFLGFICIATGVFYLATNYQNLVDRWRRFRGVRSKTLFDTRKDTV